MDAGMMLTPGEGGRRFPVFSNNKIRRTQIRNCYVDEKVIEAQLQQVQAAVESLRDHEAIYAYDLASRNNLSRLYQKYKQWLKEL